MFIVARMIGGMASVFPPSPLALHIGNCSAGYRGRLAECFSSTSFSHSHRFAQRACCAGIGENAWRWMLGVAAFPSIIYTICAWGGSRKARGWLIGRKGDRRCRSEGR